MFTQPIHYTPETAGEFKYVTGTVTGNNEKHETASHYSQVNFRVFQPKVLRLTYST